MWHLTAPRGDANRRGMAWLVSWAADAASRIRCIQRVETSAARLFIAALLLFFPRFAAAEVAPTGEFLGELQENDLTFSESAFHDFVPAAIVENPDMNYELAARSRSGLEVRYAIRRFDPRRDESMVTLESMGPAMFMATVYNVAVEDGGVLATTAFPAESVKHDFNADSGGSALVIPRATFAKGFDRCLLVSIEKKRVNAFMLYLFNSRQQDAALAEVQRIFTTLHFR